MQIETAPQSKRHDSIKYKSIEAQLFDLFKNSGKFERVDYEIEDKDLIIKADRLLISVDIKKSVKLKVCPPQKSWSDNTDESILNFSIGDRHEISGKHFPTLTIPYNQDVSKKIISFFDKLKKIERIYERAEPVFMFYNENENEIVEKIRQFLKSKFETDTLDISFWMHTDDALSGLETCFYIHPKGKAPADGVLLCFEKDTHKINPFWNGSTERRTHGSNPEEITDAIGRHFGNIKIEDMKKRIKAAEELQKKLDSFNVNDCPELKKLIADSAEGDKFIKELENL